MSELFSGSPVHIRGMCSQNDRTTTLVVNVHVGQIRQRPQSPIYASQSHNALGVESYRIRMS